MLATTSVKHHDPTPQNNPDIYDYHCYGTEDHHCVEATCDVFFLIVLLAVVKSCLDCVLFFLLKQLLACSWSDCIQADCTAPTILSCMRTYKLGSSTTCAVLSNEFICLLGKHNTVLCNINNLVFAATS